MVRWCALFPPWWAPASARRVRFAFAGRPAVPSARWFMAGFGSSWVGATRFLGGAGLGRERVGCAFAGQAARPHACWCGGYGLSWVVLRSPLILVGRRLGPRGSVFAFAAGPFYRRSVCRLGMGFWGLPMHCVGG